MRIILFYYYESTHSIYQDKHSALLLSSDFTIIRRLQDVYDLFLLFSTNFHTIHIMLINAK